MIITFQNIETNKTPSRPGPPSSGKSLTI